MGFRKLKNDERGSIPVLVALSLTVLLGFSALTVDFGMMASNKQSMQNACDAAALAGAVDLMNGRSGTVTATGYDYAAINGYDHNDDNIEVTVEQTGTTVKVTIREEMQMGFSGVLTGERTRTVSATATAESTTAFGGCPYAMFAAEKIEDGGDGININGNNITITGNIHSNSKINMKKAEIIDGVATAVGSISIGSGDKASGMVIPMPKMEAFDNALAAQTTVVFNGNSNHSFQELVDEALSRYNGTNDDLSREGLRIYINGSWTVNGHGSSSYTCPYPVTVIVERNITNNGTALRSDYPQPLYIMSRNGNITVNGGGATFTGIVFAPNGDLTINGNAANFVGSLIAQNITKNGGKITVSYVEGVDRYLPNGKVHLVS